MIVGKRIGKWREQSDGEIGDKAQLSFAKPSPKSLCWVSYFSSNGSASLSLITPLGRVSPSGLSRMSKIGGKDTRAVEVVRSR